MDITITATIGADQYEVWVKDRDLANLAGDLAMAAFVLTQRIYPLEIPALINKAKDLASQSNGV